MVEDKIIQIIFKDFDQALGLTSSLEHF